MKTRGGTRRSEFTATLVAALLLALAAPTAASDAQPVSAAGARSDLRYFAHLLETTHPDPFTSIGGRVAFQLAFQEMLAGVPAEGTTRRELYDRLRAFLGRIGDGHSYVLAPPTSEAAPPARSLPVRFAVAYDEVFVARADRRHAALVGSRLRAVAGLDLGALRQAARNVLPKENAFAAAALAVRFLKTDVQARRMLPGIGDRLELDLLDPAGKERHEILVYTAAAPEPPARGWIPTRWTGLPESPSPIVSTEWPDADAAYLGLRSIVAREAFDSLRASGRTDLISQLSNFYQRTLHRPMPDDLDRAIGELPSICEISQDLLTSMKRQGIGNLVVDLRGNDGGWSAILKPLYYMLAGDRYFESDPVRYATRISESYLGILGTDLASYNERHATSLALGDLVVRGGVSGGDPVAKRRRWLAELAESSPYCHARVAGLAGAPLYAPRLWVITDPVTFSAAYDCAYRLRSLGARTVGVPPSQAARSFVEGVPFRLPRSGLEGAISRTAVIYPDLPERDNALLLDHPVTWAVFRSHRFDPESAVLHTLDLIRKGVAGNR